MTGATHFIEVFRFTKGESSHSEVKTIDKLGYEKNLTKRYGGTTIAIWKIKFKTKDNE